MLLTVKNANTDLPPRFLHRFAIRILICWCGAVLALMGSWECFLFRIKCYIANIVGEEKQVKLVTVLLPEAYLEGLDELVRANMYPSRSSVIRSAVRDLLRKELWEKRGR
jgi:antitoxin ParD1/3/4